MVRRIGNIFLFFYLCFFSTHFLSAESIGVEMRVLDEQGAVVVKTDVGVPIILEIIVRGTSSPISKLYIDGVKNFDLEQRGTTKQLSTVNGLTSTKTVYRYMICAKKEGNYTIGPVQVVIDAKTYNNAQSHTLEVQRGYAQSYAAGKAALELKIDKQRAVVGERIPISIRFYKDKKSELLGIDPLELQNCKMDVMQGPFSGVAQRNGIQQKYIEWKTTLVAQKGGEFTIPALKAHYKEPTAYAGLHPVLLGGLFDFGYTKKSIYSNAVNFYVEPLPAYEGKVHAIGSFTAFQATLNQHEAKQGEGVVLSLELEGDGDFNAIAHPTLELPESLTYYDSKTTTAASGTKKTFEYIVQGKQEGSWEIQGQEFIFFDTQDKTYKMLQTEPLILMITASLQQNKQQGTQDIQNENVPGTSTIWPLHEKYQADQDIPEFPSYIFWLGFVCPLIVGLIRSSRALFQWYISGNSKVLRKKWAFSQTRKQIKAASKTNNTDQLYDIFISFIADWQGMERAQVSQDVIRQKLIRLSESVVAQWDIFFSKITEQAYSKSSISLQEKEELFKSAYMWLTLFQKSESI